MVQLAAKPGAALPRPRALAHRQCCAAKALPRRATPASAAAAHSGSNHATLTGAAPTRPSRPLLHGAAAGAQLLLSTRAAAAQPQRRWHSRQQLPAVVAAGGAAVGIGSAGAPPPRRVSSKTGFKHSGRAAAADSEGRVIAPGPCSKEEAETKRKRASKSNIFEEKCMAAAVSRVELLPHRSCAARLALHHSSRTGRPSRHARRHRATNWHQGPRAKGSICQAASFDGGANGGENRARASLAGAALTRPSKGRRGTPTRPSNRGRKTKRSRKGEEKKKRRRKEEEEKQRKYNKPRTPHSRTFQ